VVSFKLAVCQDGDL